MTLGEDISSSVCLKSRLQTAIEEDSSNLVCVDCNDKKPTWASLLVSPPDAPQDSPILGALCCYQCSGIHRSLGTHICFVRSVTLDDWKEKEIIAMEKGGNRVVNKIFESKLGDNAKPTPTSDPIERKSYCQEKYTNRIYYQRDAYKEIKRLKQKSLVTSELNKSNHAKTTMTIKKASKPIDPFNSKNAPVVTAVAVAKEPISEVDFFKSMNSSFGSTDDWFLPYQEKQDKLSKNQERNKSKKDELAQSWHPESPNKQDNMKITSIQSTKKTTMTIKRGLQRAASTMALTTRPTPLKLNLNEHNQKWKAKDDNAITNFRSPSKSPDMPHKIASTTSTPSSSRRRRKNNDPLSTSCHATFSTRTRDISKSRPESRQLTSDVSVTQSETSNSSSTATNPSKENAPETHNIVKSQSKYRKQPEQGRPRLQRRASMEPIASPRGRTIAKTYSSDDAVQELFNCLLANPTNNDDEAKEIGQNIQPRAVRAKVRLNQRNRKEEAVLNKKVETDENEATEEDNSNNQRSRRLERPSGSSRRDRSRSASRTRSHSVNRRAALMRQNSFSSKGARRMTEKRSTTPKRTARNNSSCHGSVKSARSARQQPSLGATIFRSTPTGTTRQPSTERPNSSKSASRHGRLKTGSSVQPARMRRLKKSLHEVAPTTDHSKMSDAEGDGTMGECVGEVHSPSSKRIPIESDGTEDCPESPTEASDIIEDDDDLLIA